MHSILEKEFGSPLEEKSESVKEFLLSHDEDGYTALHRAVYSGQHEATKVGKITRGSISASTFSELALVQKRELRMVGDRSTVLPSGTNFPVFSYSLRPGLTLLRVSFCFHDVLTILTSLITKRQFSMRTMSWAKYLQLNVRVNLCTSLYVQLHTCVHRWNGSVDKSGWPMAFLVVR